MRYLIRLTKEYDGAYSFMFETFDEALRSGMELARKTYGNVFVCKVLGTCVPDVKYEAEDK